MHGFLQPKSHITLQSYQPKFGVISCQWKENLFRFHQTPTESKVEIASINLEGDANHWHGQLKSCHGIPTWDKFVDGHAADFNPTEYESMEDELAKI